MQLGDSGATPVAPVAMPTEVTVAEKLRAPAKKTKGTQWGRWRWDRAGTGTASQLWALPGNDAPGRAAGTAIHGMG